MGRIKRGILGGFQGKVANVIGQGWKGIDVMRSMPISVANPRTPAQQSTRSKFKDLVEVSKKLGSAYLRKGFSLQAVRKTTFNVFISENMKTQDTYPTWKPQAFILAGEYYNVQSIGLSKSVGGPSGDITITLDQGMNPYSFAPTDKVSLAGINVGNNGNLTAAAAVEVGTWSQSSFSFNIPDVTSIDNCSLCFIVTKQADGRNYAFAV